MEIYEVMGSIYAYDLPYDHWLKSSFLNLP